MEQEIWKDIPWYEWRYQISNLGNVKSLNYHSTWKEWILKPWLSFWYKRVLLCIKWKDKWHSVHRLVAQAFIPNPENKREVNHINGIYIDNNIKNLEWTTPSENVLHRFKVLWHKSSMFGKFWKYNPKSKPINQYDLQWNFIKEWYWNREIERELWINRWWIIKCCKGNKKQCKWFIWKHKDKLA